MSDTLSVSITADTSDLRTNLALANAAVRDYGRQVRAVSDAVLAASDAQKAELMPQLQAVAQAAESARVRAAGFKEALAGLGDGTEHAAHGLGSFRESIGLSGTQLEHLNLRIRDSIGMFSRLGEILAVGFGAEKFAALGIDAAKFGDDLQKASEKTGLTIEQLSALKVAADRNELSFDQLQRGLLKFSDSIGLAQRETGAQRSAFQALGFSVDYLKEHGSNLSGMLEAVAEKLGQYADGGNKANLVTQLFSLRMQEFAPVLEDLAQNGMAGLEEHARSLDAEFGGDFADAARKAHDNLKDFVAQVEALKTVFGADLLPLLTAGAHALTELIQNFGDDGLAKQLNRQLAVTQDQISRIQARLAGENPFSRWLDSQTLVTANQELEALKAKLKEIAAPSVQIDWGHANALQPPKPQAPAMPASNSDSQALEAYEASIRARQAAAQNNYQQQIGLENELLAHIKASLGEQSAQYQRELTREIEIKNKEVQQLAEAAQKESRAFSEAVAKETADRVKASDDQIAIIRAQYTAATKAAEDGYAERKLTLARETADLKQAEAARAADETAQLRSRLALYEQDEEGYKHVMSQIEAADKQHQARMAEIDKTAATEGNRAAEQEARGWQQAFGNIDSDFKSFLSEVLSGHESIAQSAEQMFAKMAESFIADIAEMTLKWLAFKALTGLGTLGLGGAGALAGVVGNPFGAGATGLGGFIGSLFSAAPSHEMGTWSVAQTGPANLHQGEIVIPPGLSGQIRSGQASIGGAAGGAGSVLNFNANVSGINSKDMLTALKNPTVVRGFAAVLQRELQNSPSLRGSF